YLFVNRAHLRLHSMDRAEMVGKKATDLYPPEVVEKLLANDRRILASGTSLQFEEVVSTADGERFYLSLKFPLRDPDGNIYAVCGISTDITERKQALEHLRQEQNFLRGLLRAHERDRQLMAYEIHDGLVQDITAALWHLESLNQAVRRLSDKDAAT